MKNANTPAMPVTDSEGIGDSGLTKREHFAGLAMQGYLSMMAWSDGVDGGSVSPSYDEVAKESVAFADHLLFELEKSK